jgi:hypothetical protein
MRLPPSPQQRKRRRDASRGWGQTRDCSFFRTNSSHCPPLMSLCHAQEDSRLQQQRGRLLVLLLLQLLPLVLVPQGLFLRGQRVWLLLQATTVLALIGGALSWSCLEWARLVVEVVVAAMVGRHRSSCCGGYCLCRTAWACGAQTVRRSGLLVAALVVLSVASAMAPSSRSRRRCPVVRPSLVKGLWAGLVLVLVLVLALVVQVLVAALAKVVGAAVVELRAAKQQRQQECPCISRRHASCTSWTVTTSPALPPPRLRHGRQAAPAVAAPAPAARRGSCSDWTKTRLWPTSDRWPFLSEYWEWLAGTAVGMVGTGQRRRRQRRRRGRRRPHHHQLQEPRLRRPNHAASTRPSH